MDLSLPKYVRFNFLLVLISGALVTVSFFYLFVKPLLEVQDFMKFLFIISVGFFVYGLIMVYSNYQKEIELLSFQILSQKRQL